MWVCVNHGEHGLKTMKWFHLLWNIWNNITIEFQKIAPQSLQRRRRRVHLYIARGPGKGAQPLWPGPWNDWSGGSVQVWTRIRPKPTSDIGKFYMKLTKSDILWYFQLFSPELPRLKIRYFQETSSNLPFLGGTKTLLRLHSRKHDFTQHVGFIIFYCHTGRPVSKISDRNQFGGGYVRWLEPLM